MAIKRRTNDEWRKMIAEQEKSGQTQEEWCISKGVNLYTMRDRARRLRKMDNQEKNKRVKTPSSEIPPEWVEVKTRIQKSKEHGPQIYIEIGIIKISANSEYPPENIAEILKRMSISC